MNPKPEFQTWRWLAATLLVLSLVLSSLATATPVTAQTTRAKTVGAQHAAPLDNAPQQLESFDDLPLGLASAIAQTLADDLPDSFHLQAIKGGYQADNSNHDLTTTFSPAGPQMTISGETWGLTLTGLGRGRAIQALLTAKLVADGPRIEYRYPGLTEWYLNTTWGLEQGFTLQDPLAGKGDLVLELTMNGSLRASLQDDTTLLLANAAGQTIARYTGLHAYDATGRQLPVHLSLSPLSISIVVDDSNATYPLTIDPWLQQAKLLASDGAAGDKFGISVAISGDTVVVGAHRSDDNGTDSGSAYVFEKGGSWSDMTETAKLLPSDGAAGDKFGIFVAISGDTVVVGAHRSDDNGTDSGSAYVFVEPVGGWSGTLTETAKLLPSDGATGDQFGDRVAISGDTVVAGAHRNNVDGTDSGSAYVFVAPGGGWSGTLTETARLLPSDGAAYDFFGLPVAISGDTVVVGANEDDDNGSNSGSAYVFVEPVGGWSGTLTETAKLLPSDGEVNNRFGWSAAISGDTVVVGACWDNDNGSNSGSAYVFEEPGDGWSGTLNQSAKLLPDDGAAGDEFSWPVAISGDTVVAGACGDDDNGVDSGSAYVFEKPVGGWSGVLNQSAKLLPSDGAEEDDFGWSVAISGDTVVAGAHHDDDNGNGSGSAYIFEQALSITKSANPGLLNPGDPLTYTLNYQSNLTATDVLITDVIPAELFTYTYTYTGATITSTGGTDYVWQVQDLSPGEGGVITVTGVISTGTPLGLIFTNTAIITSDVGSAQSQAIVRLNPFMVIDVYPDPGSHNAASDTDLTILPNGAADPASVTADTIFVHGDLHGRLDGVFSFGSITFDPDEDLHPGELVQTSVTTDVQTFGGTPLVASYVWSFRAAVDGGSGYFIDSGQNLGNTGSVAALLGDLDGDGDLDTFLANYDQPNKVWLNDGGGIFTDTGQSLGTCTSEDAALGDLDGDGDLDVFIANYDNQPNKVWLNDGGGIFTDTGQSLGNSSSRGVDLGDVDGDGDLDAFVANYGKANNIWLNDGSGVFSSSQNLGSSNSTDVDLGDVDGDGDLDVFVSNQIQPNLVWLNDGSGNFSNSNQFLGDSNSWRAALGDVDGDGDLDAFVANSNQANRIWLNDGSGAFTDSGQTLGTFSSLGIALGDVDGDGDLDAFVANYSNQADKVWLNDGSGIFSDSGQSLGTSSSYDVDLGDVDGDGDLDASVAKWPTPPSLIWLNQNPADVSILKTVEPALAASGDTIIYTLNFSSSGDFDATGVVITDVIPVSMTVQSVVNSGALITDTGAVPAYVWDVEDLIPGAGGIITITAVLSDPLTAGGIVNTAIITSSDDDNPDNNTSSVTLTPPVADDDAFTVVEDSSDNVLDVLDGDTDPNGDALTVDAVSDPPNGTAIDNDVNVLYTPDSDFFGTDAFTYTVTDGLGGYDTATVVVTVTGVQDPPVAMGEAYTVTEDIALVVAAPGVLANDSDSDGDALDAIPDNLPVNGSLTLNLDGSFVYTPNLDFFGVDDFSYHAYDGDANSNIVTVTLTVEPVNDPPLAVDDSAATAEDTPVTLDVLANDSDPDGDSLTVISVTQPLSGAVVINPDSTVNVIKLRRTGILLNFV